MKKIGLALFILALLYAATGWFLAPRFADKALHEFASGRLGLELRFENLLLYPFGFSAQLENLVILDRDGQPLFTAAAVEAQSGPVGFWTHSARFKRLVLDQPVLHVSDSETGRAQLVELLARLSAYLESPAGDVQIDDLRLQGATIVRNDSPNLPPGSMAPSLDLQMASLGPSRSGPFQITFEPGGGESVRMGGEMAWQATGPTGNLHFSDEGALPQVPPATGSMSGGNGWSGLSLDAPFSLDVTGQGLVFQIRRAKLAARSLQLGLQPLAAIRMNDVSAGFGLELKFDSQGLAIPFDLQLATAPGGEIRLAGQYGPAGGNGALELHLQDFPMRALFGPNSEHLPQALAGELLTATGRLQLSQPFASIALSGGFASGADLNFSGMSQYEDPLRDSRFELGLSGLDATSVSSWAEAFAGRRILSGALGARLAVRTVDGSLAGRYELSADDLRLEESDPATANLDGDPDFLFALLQDADRHVEFTVSLDDQSRVAGTGFANWLGQETARHLAGLGERPFDTLARNVGVTARTLRSVAFQAGQAGLTPRAVAQLEWLKTALQWRPGLALRVTSGYDPEADRYALASQQILLHVNLATAVSAAERANSAPVDLADPKAQSVLDEFAGSRLGRERVEAIWRNFQLTEEGADASLAATDNIAFYRALFDALVENEQISERALLSLARFRARTVIDQLANSGIDRQRLESLEPEAVRSEVGSGVPTRFELHTNQAAVASRIE